MWKQILLVLITISWSIIETVKIIYMFINSLYFRKFLATLTD